MFDNSNEYHPGSLLHKASLAEPPRCPRAVTEGVDTDVDWPGRQRDLAQGRAPVEGVMSNLGEVGR